MIGGNILGGLGNMMFVIAAIENLAKANNTNAYFPNVKSHLNKVQDDRSRIYPDSDVSTLDYLKNNQQFFQINRLLCVLLPQTIHYP